ncbi:MAG: SBBP repeat-containing protein, partial [Ignavibacteria bacterium]
MKLLKYISVILFIFLLEEAFSQPTLQWAKRYNGPLNEGDQAWGVFVDDSGYVYVTGSINGTFSDYGTIKYNKNGDTMWVRVHGPGGGYKLTVDKSGNVYVAGGPSSLKYDKNGNLLWAVMDTVGSGAVEIALDDSGYVYLGVFRSQGNYFVTLKYTNNGNLIWEKLYFCDWGRPYDMTLDKWNNVIIVGRTGYPGSPTSYDFVTIKYNSSGDSLWGRVYNGPDPNNPYDFAHAVAVDDTGNVYVTGWSDNENSGADYITFKYDANGNEKWMRRFNIGGGGSSSYDIDVDKSGNVYVTGTTSSNYTTVKYLNDGTFQWARTIPGVSFPPWNKLALDTIGNVYVAANQQRGAWSDLVIAKYNTNGLQQWLVLYPGSGTDYGSPNDIFVDKLGFVYATGHGRGTGGQDYLTVKYSQVIGIQPISNEIPKEYKLYQNYPNPFNSNSKIKFQISNLSFVGLVVYDVLGRNVSEFVNEQLNPGVYEYNFSANDLPSGVYLYRLTV